MGDIKMSARGRKRLEMLSLVKKDALITQAKGSELLGIGYRHTRRVCERYGEEADRGPIVGLAADSQAAGSRKSHQKMTVKAKQYLLFPAIGRERPGAPLPACLSRGGAGRLSRQVYNSSRNSSAG